jgi:hypothetical protein
VNQIIKPQVAAFKSQRDKMRKKKINWQINDVFAIPLLNGKYSVGYILDQRMVNTVRIALYDEVVVNLADIDVSILVNTDNLISLIEVTREQLDYNVWKIVGHKKTDIPVERYPNEQFRANKWINSIVYDAALAEDFVNAFNALIPWDDWYDPNFLDEFLVSTSKKPKKIIYKKNNYYDIHF